MLERKEEVNSKQRNHTEHDSRHGESPMWEVRRRMFADRMHGCCSIKGAKRLAEHLSI